MPRILFQIPPPNFSLTDLQTTFNVSLETAFLIRRLCCRDLAPEDIPESAPILEQAAGLQLSDEERILWVINAWVNGQGLGYLTDRSALVRFPYIDLGDPDKLTLLYLSLQFMLGSVAEVVGRYRLKVPFRLI